MKNEKYKNLPTLEEALKDKNITEFRILSIEKGLERNGERLSYSLHRSTGIVASYKNYFNDGLVITYPPN